MFLLAGLGRRRYANCAVLLEHNGFCLSKSNIAAIKAANKIAGSSDKVAAIALAHNPSPSLMSEMENLPGISKLVICNRSEHQLAESVAPQLVELQGKLEGVTHWVTPHSSRGRDLFPRFAAMIQGKTAAIADITDVVSENKFKRPIYAGNYRYLFTLLKFKEMRFVRWRLILML